MPKKKKAAKKSAKSKIAKKQVTKKKGKNQVVYLGMGSNVGEREEFIEQAIFLLDKLDKVRVVKKSTNYENPAEGSVKQPPFINMAVEIETTLSPRQLLDAIHEIEETLGRERDIEWGPRTIDIDILLFDDLVLSEDNLQIPHPLLHERVFVLKPLNEIAPDAIHPTIGKSIADLFAERKADVGDKYDDELPGFGQIKTSYGDDYERW